MRLLTLLFIGATAFASMAQEYALFVHSSSVSASDRLLMRSSSAQVVDQLNKVGKFIAIGQKDTVLLKKSDRLVANDSLCHTWFSPTKPFFSNTFYKVEFIANKKVKKKGLLDITKKWLKAKKMNVLEFLTDKEVGKMPVLDFRPTIIDNKIMLNTDEELRFIEVVFKDEKHLPIYTLPLFRIDGYYDLMHLNDLPAGKLYKVEIIPCAFGGSCAEDTYTLTWMKSKK